MTSSAPLDASTHAFHHLSVMGQEVLTGLNLKDDGHYLDVTVGGGGHSALILAENPTIRVTALDQDIHAIEAAKNRLKEFGDRVEFWHGNFSEYSPDLQKFDGIVADLGVSSAQFDQPHRGFSFRHEAPLDMRMNPSQARSAAQLINHASEKDLADMFYQYGEERMSRRIARAIVQRRPLQTTTQLADVIISSLPATARKKRWRIHPATRVFQALRIAVNRELEVLEKLLALSPHWLNPQGRLCIISFHSLEDRLVKYGFRDNDTLDILTKKPLIPSDVEQRQNSRSRSAKLRIAQKL